MSVIGNTIVLKLYKTGDWAKEEEGFLPFLGKAAI
jgi:hypothetical protein